MTLATEPTQHDGRPHLRLSADDGASAEVSLYGAQVTSWRPEPGQERLYLSPKAGRAAGTAIRGGIPVIFPQFAGRGPLAKHGFARLLDWRFAGVEAPAASPPAAVFELRDSDATHALWPARFHARLRVALAPSSLEVGLEIRNDDETPFAFTAALHTYLRVDDLRTTSLHGLEDAPYLDSTRIDGEGNEARVAATGEAIRFATETDRIYPDSATRQLALRDDRSAVRILADGFRDTIVWNPGAALAASIADLGADEHLRFVCVESGTVIQPVVLAPGHSWQGRQVLQEASGID